VLEYSIHAALEREAHYDVGPVCSCKTRNDLRKEGVIAAPDKMAPRVTARLCLR
jgi:hypothetical protein